MNKKIETIDKLKLFKKRGWRYNKETGDIISHKGKIVKSIVSKIMLNKEQRIEYGLKDICISKNQLAWYLAYGKSEITFHIDGNKQNNLLSNLTNINPNPKKKKSVNKPQPKQKYIKKNHYLNDIDLTYEIVLSQGLGKLTPKCEKMLILISNRLISKFNFKNSDYKYDVKMQGLYMMLYNWNKFDYDRYNSAFPYFTEICKRGFANGLNIVRDYNPQDKLDFPPNFVSFDCLYSA